MRVDDLAALRMSPAEPNGRDRRPVRERVSRRLAAEGLADGEGSLLLRLRRSSRSHQKLGLASRPSRKSWPVEMTRGVLSDFERRADDNSHFTSFVQSRSSSAPPPLSVKPSYCLSSVRHQIIYSQATPAAHAHSCSHIACPPMSLGCASSDSGSRHVEASQSHQRRLSTGSSQGFNTALSVGSCDPRLAVLTEESS